jgi:hypothetical protein
MFIIGKRFHGAFGREEQIKGVGPTVFHKKEWPTWIQIPCARKRQILFC